MGKDSLKGTLFVHGCILALKVLLIYPLSIVMKMFKFNPKRLDCESELKLLLPFMMISYLYTTIEPPTTVATTMFRLFTISRWLDTICSCVLECNHITMVRLEIMSSLSYIVTGFMAYKVLGYYRYAL